MELDVHLTRDGDEPWGFEFVGGSDCHIPLTIEKVLPSTPADAAGLQAGDLIARLGDRLAADLSRKEAEAIVAESVGSLSFGICRGLYDPVLDDFEPIYEPTDRADSDLRSEPTEVYPLDLSVDESSILDPSITDLSLWDSGYATRPLTETRSLTASPFIPNSKPYRPFSTEPLEVPPLDDPIILNPNYKDIINLNGNSETLDPNDDLLCLLPLDKNVESKFKLPVSEKYDPDWDKKVKAMLEKCADSGNSDNQQIEHELVCYTNKSEAAANVKVINEIRNVKITEDIIQESEVSKNKIVKKEINFDEIEEFNLQKIEQTALEIVEESIERAVSVTQDIQKEIDEERASMVRELQGDKIETTSEVKVCTETLEMKEQKKEVPIEMELTESTQNKTETLDTNQESGIDMTEREKIQEKLEQDKTFVEERILSTKKDIEDTIEIGNVRRKSSVFEKQDAEFRKTDRETKHLTEESILASTVKRQSMVLEKDEKSTGNEMLRNACYSEKTKSKHNAQEFKSSGMFNNETFQSEGKQKAFMIGLQTIPHIKGFVQSSYHFDLLLRTFFVHLTDVMVALSRFILTQPAQELESKAENVVKEKLIKEFIDQDSMVSRNNIESRHEEKKESVQSVKENKLQERDIKQETEIIQAEQHIKVADIEKQQENIKYKKETQEMQQPSHHVKKENLIKSQVLVCKKQDEVDSESIEMRKRSGAEMAQRTQRKSRDLTQKMDAVITEFETKTGIDEKLELTEQRKRRSRSRSQIEEEVMRESDPLEWLDKVDSRRASQERTGIIVGKELSSYSEFKDSKRCETKRESRTTKVKPGKQMYIAIVESHVYTNKDAILEDQVAEMSETASIQSSEEINAALESFEAISTENVTINNVVHNEEKQEAVEVITNALQEVVQEEQRMLDTFDGFKSQINEQHTKSIMQESHAFAAAEAMEITSESKIETFKASEVKESTALAIQEENYKTAAVEFIDVPLESTKEVVVVTKLNEQEAVLKQEIRPTIAAEATEIVNESKIQSFKGKKAISKQAVVSSEENYKAAAESSTDIILEATKEETTEFNAKEHKAVSKVESHTIAVAGSTDVIVDDSKVETFESEKHDSETAMVKSEDTFKTAAIGATEVAFEIVENKHSERAKTSEVTVKEKAQHLAVAGIIETKTELCKEPKKPAEDEYASLKIVKEQIIDEDDSVQVTSQSELINVKKSLEVDISSSHLQAISQSISQESSLGQMSSVQETSSLVQEMSSSVQESSISSLEASNNIQKCSKSKSLHINTNIAQNFEEISEQIDENNNTPTPTTLPPTPLTDEYVFKLEIPLPKNQGTVIIEDSPDREDPHIVKKGLVPYIETTIEEQIIYDPPLPTPPEDKVQPPVYTKPGLKGGAAPLFKKEYIREIERKSSLLASAIDETIKSIEEYKEEVGIELRSDVTIQLPKKTHTDINNGISNGHEENGMANEFSEETKEKYDTVEVSRENGTNATESMEENDILPGFKPVVFNPEAYQARLYEEVIKGTEPAPVEVKPYVDESGEPLGTVLGIVDGLEDAIVDEEVAKELGKPGLTEDKIAELISGESEMLREAHVMGVDFQKIKPLYESLKDSEVLKALNEEMKRELEEKKKKEEKKWTTFLQKPKRPVPRSKLGYGGYRETEEFETEEPYTVKIVKQPKPKVAPDYKPEDFDTGPLPWEQRALMEPVPSPVPPEEPILVPEEAEFFEAVDPLPETEVPDLEDTGIPLPPTPPPVIAVPPFEPEPEAPPDLPETEPEIQVETPPSDMNQNSMAEQIVNTVKSMVDPKAPLEQQLSQMRAQLAALAQLPCVIQQSLELLTRQLSARGRQENHEMSYEAQMNVESRQETHENHMTSIEEYQDQVQNNKEASQNYQEVLQNGTEVMQNGHDGNQKGEQNTVTIEEVQEPMMTADEVATLKREQDAMIVEQIKSEKEKKERQEIARLEQESRQVKQRAPRVGKPRPVFGPLTPEDRPVVLPGGRRWRCPRDAYNEQLIAETIQAQSEILQGKVMGYESDRLPYDERINFMKFEKPPVSLEHLQHSATYKLVHNMEEAPLKRTDLLKPVIAEADYRERCRSATPTMLTNGRV